MPDLSVIGFDADDTLWHHERFFELTTARFAELVSFTVTASPRRTAAASSRVMDRPSSVIACAKAASRPPAISMREMRGCSSCRTNTASPPRFDADVETEVRSQLRHVKEGTSQCDIEYARVLETVKRKRGLG